MHTSAKYLISIILLLSFGNAYAASTCKQFNNTNYSKQGKFILSLVDQKLRKWPANNKLKTMMTEPERIDMFKDSMSKMVIYCKDNDDFNAGMALGEDLTIYKQMLLRLQ